MKLKAIALGGAAALALTLGANAGFAQTTTTNPTTNEQAAPAQAQSAPDNAMMATPTAKPAMHRYRHHVRSSKTADETPAERSQTVDLNKQELAKVDNTSNTSVAGNGAPTATSNTAAKNIPPANEAGTPTAVTAQNAPATNETSPTNDADRTTVAQANSSAQMNAASTAPASSKSASNAGMAKAQSLDSVSNPKSTLASATVRNSNGQPIGQVKKISVGSNGKTQAVDVQIQGQGGASSKTIRLDANDLSYDKDNNVLITPLSSDQLNNMPSSPM